MLKNEGLPLVVSVHHGSGAFVSGSLTELGLNFSRRVALSREQQRRFSDYGTNTTAPRGIGTVVASAFSRGVVDLNRSPDDPARFRERDFSKGERGPNKVWKKNMGPSGQERNLLDILHRQYHKRIERLTRRFNGRGLVVAWDNTADYVIGQNEAGEDVMMPDFIISNRGKEGSTHPNEGEFTTCDPEMLEFFVTIFKRHLESLNLPSDIRLNLVYKGGYVAQRHTTWSKDFKKGAHLNQGVQSFQIEYNTRITHDQTTLKPDIAAMKRLRQAAEAALSELMNSKYFVDSNK